MPRFARVVAVDVAHHVTQRGNAQRVVFHADADYLVYLELLHANSQRQAQTLRHTHGRYAAYLDAGQRASGHVWQGRYYSCQLDTAHQWAALRYAELNPMRAGMAHAPELRTSRILGLALYVVTCSNRAVSCRRVTGQRQASFRSPGAFPSTGSPRRAWV